MRPTPFKWGFYLDGAYHFLENNDAIVEWYHYAHKIGQIFYADGWDSPVQASQVNATYHPRWDAVNMMLGQKLVLTEKTQLRVSGGAQYARLKNSDQYISGLIGQAQNTLSQGSVTYNGFGARTGLDLFFNPFRCLQVYDKVGGSILVGKNKFNDSFGAVNSPPVSLDSESRTAVVPEIDMKLGAKYTHSFSQSDLSLDAGYM